MGMTDSSAWHGQCLVALACLLCNFVEMVATTCGVELGGFARLTWLVRPGSRKQIIVFNIKFMYLLFVVLIILHACSSSSEKLLI